ncbi:hypothetical protein ACLOJK_027467, partial [Asimina triloba]
NHAWKPVLHVTTRRRYGGRRGHGGGSQGIGRHLPRYRSHNPQAVRSTYVNSTEISAAPPL